MASNLSSCLICPGLKVDEILPARAVAGTTSLSRTSSSLHILVVEDDDSIRRLLAKVLLGAGYAVDTAEDGAAAWEALGAGNYDLMITDNIMPKVTGVELLERLHTSHQVLPVIMATGVPPKQDFAQHPWLQPGATLCKPYNVEELLRTVAELLRRADVCPEQIG